MMLGRHQICCKYESPVEIDSLRSLPASCRLHLLPPAEAVWRGRRCVCVCVCVGGGGGRET